MVSMFVVMVTYRVDSEGESGVNYVVRLAVYLLDPNRLEYSAAFIGRFIIVFIKKVSIILYLLHHVIIICYVYR